MGTRNRPSFLLSRFFLPRVPMLVRTRVAIGCSFFLQGMVFATWCARIPDVRARLGLDEAQLGTLLLAIPIGQLLSMAPNGLLVSRFGSRRMLIAAGFLYPCVLFCLGVVSNVWALALGLLAAGFAANLSNTAANTQGVQLERYYRRSIIALFHGMWSLAGLVAVALALALAPFGVPTWLHFTLVAAGLALLLAFSGGALLRFDRAPAPAPGAARHALWRLTPYLFWIGVASLGCMACEGTIYDWSGVYFRDVLQVSPEHQSLGYFAYLCAMVSCRFLADRAVNRFGAGKVLYGCGVCIAGGLALAVLMGGAPPAMAVAGTCLGFALVGCGTSAVVPIGCGLAGRAPGVPTGIAIAQVSTIGFFGFLAAPPLIGHVAHASDLRTAFALMAAIGLLVLVATRCLRLPPARAGHARGAP